MPSKSEWSHESKPPRLRTRSSVIAPRLIETDRTRFSGVSWSMLENDATYGVNLGDYWYGAFYSVPAAKGAWELRFTGLWTQTDFVKPPGAPGFINDAIHTNTVRLVP